MHCLFLGIFRRHCRVIWGMDLRFEDGDGDVDGDVRSNEIVQNSDADQWLRKVELRHAWRVLCTGSESAVRKLRQSTMRQLCENLDIATNKTDQKKLWPRKKIKKKKNSRDANDSIER